MSIFLLAEHYFFPGHDKGRVFYPKYLLSKLLSTKGLLQVVSYVKIDSSFLLINISLFDQIILILNEKIVKPLFDPFVILGGWDFPVFIAHYRLLHLWIFQVYGINQSFDFLVH